MNNLLTVLMAIHAIDKFTDKAINSILNQSLHNFEFIIVVNGSNSNDVEKYIRCKFSDPRITLIFSRLHGLANSLNLGLQNVSTKYVARMDSDDISHVDRFKFQLDEFLKDDSLDVVGCKVDLIDENDKTLPDKFLFVKESNNIKSMLPIINTLCHPALMFKTQSIVDIGGYKFGFHSEDHEMFLRMAFNEQRSYKFINIDKVLFNYRRHSFQLTANNTKKISMEVSTFLYMYFFKTYNVKFLLGILLVSRPMLLIKKLIRKLIRRIK